MAEFWESTFSNNEKMWGEQPTDNAHVVCKLMQKRGVKNILVPGFGYGRNAKVFYDNGFIVSGIEISKTAIKRAQKKFNNNVCIHHGSVNNMPFDQSLYDGIYCYSLIHLLNKTNRQQLLSNCYKQLKAKGIMVFVALSVKDTRYGVGEKIEKDTFRIPQGLNLFFYTQAAITEEFGKYNIIQATEINEPLHQPTEKHWMIVCQKKD